MAEQQYLMGKNIGISLRNMEAQQLTFVVTQECNLACKYCYMHGKNTENRMSLETAKAAVDYFIDDIHNFFNTSHVIIDFIGGEPLLEIDLIEQITDYFKLRMYQKKSKWFGQYRIMIGTNGVLYNDEKVQKFIRKNSNMVSIGMTIDGTKEKHDLQRVFPDNSGSYDIVKKNIELLLKQYPESITKVTIGHEDLPYLKESIVHLWDMGLHEVPANVVFEDVWKEGDVQIFEEQLIALADYIIANKLWNKVNCSLFQENIGFHLSENDLMHSICGTGKIFTVDANGDIYSCVRFMDYSLTNKKAICFGNVWEGIDSEKTRPFNALVTKYLSPQKCIDCMINSDCAYCAGYNYDISCNDTLFDRALYICEMHKARVRANRYYWARLYNEHGIQRLGYRKPENFLYFMLAENSISFCNYRTKANSSEIMTPELLIDGLEYAYQNFYFPIFIHSENTEAMIKEWSSGNEALNLALNKSIIKHIVPFKVNTMYSRENLIIVYDGDNFLFSKDNLSDTYDTAILTVSNASISNLAYQVELLLEFFNRVHINLILENKSFDKDGYDKQLKYMSEIIIKIFGKTGRLKEINKLTDRIYLKKMNNCFVGEKNMTLGVDGKLYLCPAFYYSNSSVGDMNKAPEEYIVNQSLLKNAPLCSACDAYQCNRCIASNKDFTGEYNIPPKIQCELAHIERENSRILLDSLKLNYDILHECSIKHVDYTDPLDLFNNHVTICRL